MQSDSLNSSASSPWGRNTFAMLTCPDEFISKVSLFHKESRTPGQEGPVPAEWEAEAGRQSSKWEIQATDFNQVLKGLGFPHPLNWQPQPFSSASHNCLFNCPFWINMIFHQLPVGWFSTLSETHAYSVLFHPRGCNFLPPFLSLLNFHCREFGELEENSILCLVCQGEGGDLIPRADSWPRWATRPTLPVVLMLFP